MMKEGKADKETVGGGDSGNNVVKKCGDGDIGGGEDVVCSTRGCSNKGVQAIAFGKSKRIKEKVEGTEPSPKRQNIAWDVLPLKRMQRIEIEISKGLRLRRRRRDWFFLNVFGSRRRPSSLMVIH